MNSRKKLSHLSKSPASIFVVVAASVFVSEAAVMLLLAYLPQPSMLGVALLDATLLVMLISPALYFFLFRPLVEHIRERERVEELLHRNEEEQFKLMLRTSLDAFLIADLQGHILEVNDAYCHMLGYERAELLKMNTADLAVIEPGMESMQHFRQLLETGSDRSEARRRHKDGSIRIVEESSNYSELYGGRIYGFMRDITERKAADEHRERLLDELGSANGELRNFAYVVSHDLKAPLRAISSLAEWLSTDYADKLDEAGKEQLRLLVSRVYRMDALIDGILLYSRVGRIKETLVSVDIDQLVRDVMESLAPPSNIEITLADTLPTVVTEPTRMRQVFQNLISNAIKYMDKPEGKIRINCREQGVYWQFSVTDNGPGISRQHFDKIFQLFQTLAPRDRVESTGVGLALVKKIVEMYGGQVWVESTVGEGSTFSFTVPRRATVHATSKRETA